MKIKVYILTYNDAEGLNNNLETFHANMGPKPDGVEIEVYIMNNYPIFELNPKFDDKVTIYQNMARPSWSTGHLSRSWNQCLMLGFQDLNAPDCDIVVCIQDDMVWEYDWLHWLLEVHKKYNFYTCSWGDAFCSYTAEAVKKIGMWDERFCTLGIGEADYFLRAVIYNFKETSLNDQCVGRLLNAWVKPPDDDDDHGKEWVPGEYHIFTKEYLKGNIANRAHYINTERQMVGAKFHQVSKTMWKHKWGDIPMEFWDAGFLSKLPKKPLCPTYVTYPYFEHAIYDLPNKGYFQ